MECNFESGLRFGKSIILMNSTTWSGCGVKKYNPTALHCRTGVTQTELLRITPAQLIKTPSVEVCLELAVSQPESRKVNNHIRVSFRGSEIRCAASTPAFAWATTLQIDST
ncbi:MAG: hypothetical protein ACL7BU_05990 [Candidatus Phlomobacter fragariae]